MSRAERRVNTVKSKRPLRTGYTTGTCAAAAAKAAVIRLLTGEGPSHVTVTLPNGETARIEIEKNEFNDNTATSSVIKHSGDDPDITDGITVRASVTKTDKGVEIDGGEGVGRVRADGLDQKKGEAAINSVPRRMIRDSVIEASPGYTGGFRVVISVPHGREIAAKTFNPRLGIEGGVSILGTSGIVYPMSSRAVLDTIYLEMKTVRARGCEKIFIVPGNYGETFARDFLGIEKTVQCSNFIGDALDFAEELGFSSALLIAHIGKMSKLAVGVMNTHSACADARMEAIALCAALAGETNLKKILACPTADAAYEIVRDTKTIPIMMDRIEMYMNRRVNIKTGAVMFSNKYGVVGKTRYADEIMKEN